MKLQEFEWSDELSVGVTEMDDQHKVLIRKINALVHSLEEGGESSKAFDEMATFVVSHFDDEEKFMESIRYPGLDLHKNIHKQLLDKVGAFKSDIDQGTVDSFKLITFLNMWLKSHIMGIDMKYGAHSQEKSA